jgi:hypothetical protein
LIRARVAAEKTISHENPGCPDIAFYRAHHPGRVAISVEP